MFSTLSSLFFTLLVLALAACGTQPNTPQENLAPPSTTASSIPAASDAKFLGFVANAFEVDVDGQNYKDLEDFYTQELGRLPKKIQDAGFGPETRIQFEAAIGFADLWNGMSVYVASTEGSGYQGEAKVQRNGSFEITLPLKAMAANYKVRANKRMRVVITGATGRTTYCYNFSAREQSVPFDGESKPIILQHFETTLTRYDCPSASTSEGLVLPPKEATTAPTLSPGASKNEVLSVLGSLGLTIPQSQEWCWDARLSKGEICSIAYIGPCSCSVQFDDKGALLGVNNVQAKFLNVLAW